MPYSATTFDYNVRSITRALMPGTVCDIGAGSGKYGRMVRDVSTKLNRLVKLTAAEIDPAYIAQFSLGTLYDEVINDSAVTLLKDVRRRFDLVIIGDCIEHLRKSDGVDLINFLVYRTGYVLVVFPSEYLQDDSNGHISEAHISVWSIGDFQGFNVTHLSRDDMHLVLIRGYQPYPVEINALTLNGVIGRGPSGARGTTAGVPQLIDDMVQEVNVINLDRSTERFDRFSAVNRHLRVQRAPAIDGQAVSRATLLAEGTIRDDLDYLPDALGRALSHVALWRKAAFENRAMTIFEDDTACSLHFSQQSTKVLGDMPLDWDIVVWGIAPGDLQRSLSSWMDFGLAKGKRQLYGEGSPMTNIEEVQRAPVSSQALKMVHVLGTIAYTVSPRGARRLLDYCLPLRKRAIELPDAGAAIPDKGIDCAMCGAFASMQVFLCLPPLVIRENH